MSLGLTVSLLSGCKANKAPGPELGFLYNQSAGYDGPERNPVVVLPGILGSRLTEDGTNRVVWGAFTGDYANPSTDDGLGLISLPMTGGEALADLKDDVRPIGVLDRVEVSILGLPVQLAAYVDILTTLGVGGYRDRELGLASIDYGTDHFTCFQFAYDWRRDIVESARALDEYLRANRRIVELQRRSSFGQDLPPVKFDLVAHSMGGLVARYYLRYGTQDLPADGSMPELNWAGAELVDRLIIIGTPNAGSIYAFQDLVDGKRIAPLIPPYPAAALGTMPSVYQLLPRPRHRAYLDSAGEPIGDIYDPQLWIDQGWGLADPEQADELAALLPEVEDPDERLEIALRHQALCLRRAQQFHAALDLPADPPEGVEVFLFAGDAAPTHINTYIDLDTGEIALGDRVPGDGTVARSSALMDERLGRHWSPKLNSPIAWAQAHFLFTDHLGLTRDPGFTDNMLYLLLEDPRN